MQAEVSIKKHAVVHFRNFVIVLRPTLAQRFLGLANANCEKTRKEKGKTSGEFVSDSWFG